MEYNRIQKLLLSDEYCDFSDKVLIESPFAETTRDGQGVRQVALGLTASKLVIAADIMKKHAEFTCPTSLDPSIESFELVSIYPIELIALSIYCRRKRKTLKARLVDGRAKYYELGGMKGSRSLYWSLWMASVMQLNEEKRRWRDEGSSLSETTAASSSSSASTLHLLSSGIETKRITSERKYRVWARYGGAGDANRASTCPLLSWQRKDIYLGPSYEELSQGNYYTPVPVRFAGASLDQVNGELMLERQLHQATSRRINEACCAAAAVALFTRKRHRRTDRATSEHAAALAPKLSRFGFRVGENCRSGLYMEAWHGDKTASKISQSRIDPRALIDSGVDVWEHPGDCKYRRKSRSRHPRRYALATAAHFFHALGPWSVLSGERESVQRPRACSAVSIRRQPIEPELRLALSKRQLAASVSMTSLDPCKTAGIVSSSSSSTTTTTTTTRAGRILLFWTPDYWYRPGAARVAYQQLRRHLGMIREFRARKERPKKQFFSKFAKTGGIIDNNNSQQRGGNLVVEEISSRSIIGRIFSSKVVNEKKRESIRQLPGDGVSRNLRRLLRMDLRITAWDLDSWTIARQLTLIDRELLLRIPWVEIEILLNQGSSRNAPNLGAWIAFSHRISSLMASEILSTKKLDMRTRLLSRLINAADKCYALGNFHSCRSILAGLESPAIYRLEATWSRLRTRHSTGYQSMHKLCQIYRNTRSKIYEDAWKKCRAKGPSLPYVGHLLDTIIYPLLDDEKIQQYRPFQRNISETIETNDCKKIVAAIEKTKKKNSMMGEEGRRISLTKRFVSATMSKIVCSEQASRRRSTAAAQVAAARIRREQQLAKKYYSRWRLSILGKKILADKEAKIDAKKVKITKIVRWLYECQKNCQRYNFPRHSFAWEFLLKARYHEERDNFFTSLKLEPPVE